MTDTDILKKLRLYCVERIEQHQSLLADCAHETSLAAGLVMGASEAYQDIVAWAEVEGSEALGGQFQCPRFDC